jgi:hypothetical protein
MQRCCTIYSSLLFLGLPPPNTLPPFISIYRFYVAQTKICVFKLKLSENISSYIIITYMFRLCFCLCCFSSGCLNIKWTKFSPSSSLYICRDLFHFCPVVVVVDRCGCMYVHIFLGCLVFGYFEAHTSDGHSSIN